MGVAKNWRSWAIFKGSSPGLRGKAGQRSSCQQDRERPKKLRRARKSIEKAMENLECVERDWGHYKVTQAQSLLQEAKQDLLLQLSRKIYASPNLSTGIQPELGNIERDRRLFVAWLIFKKARYTKQLRRICPTGDPFANMANYASTKGYSYAHGGDLSDLARKAVDRYKRTPDLPAALVISWVYSHFVWVTKQQAGYSNEEGAMLAELTAKATESKEST